MINIHPWVQFIREELGTKSNDIAGRDYDTIRFISVNVLCTFLTNMIADVLKKYAQTSNIPKDHHYHINMKNEYLFTKMLLIPVKKRYIASIRLREGKEIFPEKLEIKGLDFVKSSTREETLSKFKKIIKSRIVDHNTVDLIGAMRDLKEFAAEIRSSLERGEKTYLNPENAKEPEAYADPYRMQSFRSVLAWNIAYPEQQIALPEKVDAVKLNVESMDDLRDLEDTHPEIFENLVSGIFESDDEKLKAKGLTVIAIPRNVDKIPDWIIPLIDYESIVNKNVSQFESVLESMGSKSFKLDDRTIFTNIKKVG